jgi:acyl carrier protein
MSKKRVWRRTLAAAAMTLNLLTGAAEASTSGASRRAADSGEVKDAGTKTIKQRRELIRKIIAEVLKVDIGKVRPEADFVADLGGDSLGLIECRLRIEEAFRLEISDKDAQGMMHVRDVYDYVEAHTGKSK